MKLLCPLAPFSVPPACRSDRLAHHLPLCRCDEYNQEGVAARLRRWLLLDSQVGGLALAETGPCAP